ncbi:hypothetical protein BDW42DRAFT_167686 [Aspergillus taichungensis]|uniref:MARVEL domain-containing protein n=1 Tax=Aspergillus taichungensis TaxID=482145 RepID=A0A2J5HWX3_9EURO|nr:hypothetical protein BDW42DRAFT_167686 [Aspergillus taichungensis]
MRSKSVKPSLYRPLPFHIIRTVGFISSLIVAIILAVFVYRLHADNFKLPWAFLVILITAILSLLNYVLTTIVHCGYGLAPRVSLTFNSIMIFLWLLSFGLLCYGMSHTILTTCNATYWGNSTGINVCRAYKALFAFIILSILAHIAAAILDVITRNRQTRLGAYDPMASNQALSTADYKMHNRGSSVMSTTAAPGPYEDHYPLYSHSRDNSTHDDPFHDGPDPHNHLLPDDRHPLPPVYGARSAEQYHQVDAHDYYDSAPAALSQRRAPRARYNGYEQADVYGRQGEYTAYDAGAYR